ncbi:Plant thionin family protein [Arabidopsis thaliana]|uniref:Plant thionin family protein n=1 Tax=Arabidopsis thaliana TaxID=3702 RepID=A8MS10_ARATH|nr:Plant thionin family protein [Arabidopsis thaliana]AEE33522.1 Plant thionin family protein [Arabidopsis thaliana]|eukprot:NP_001077741.1 Plant thionin family protein [Arabidopsis thaliana]
MAPQTMKKICSVLMIVVLFMMMVSTYASTLEVCVKHCVPNQCMKVSEKATLPLCENACKKLCNENKFSHEKSIVPRSYCDGLWWWLCKKPK